MAENDDRSKSFPFNEHDTPPPILFMQGSCIIEIPKPRDAEAAAAEVAFDDAIGAFAAERPFIAHVKVVDGSGDMLFKFDNKSKERLTVSFRLAEKDETPAGELSFNLEAGATHPPTKKIAMKLNDPAIGGRRLRFRCMKAANEEDVDITGVLIEKNLSSGSLLLYNVSFADLKSGGDELKVMLWLEPH